MRRWSIRVANLLKTIFVSIPLVLVLARNLHFLLPETVPFYETIGKSMAYTFWFYVHLVTVQWNFTLEDVLRWVIPFSGITLFVVYVRFFSDPRTLPSIVQILFHSAELILFFFLGVGNLYWDGNPVLSLGFALYFVALVVMIPILSRCSRRVFALWAGALIPLIFLVFLFPFTPLERTCFLSGSPMVALLLSSLNRRDRLEPGTMVLLFLLSLLTLNTFALLPHTPPGLPKEAVLLGKEPVYLFCEVPGKGKIFAAAPHCEGRDWEDCPKGEILEYDLKTLQKVEVHRFFHDDFYGRIVHIFCLNTPPWILVSLSSVPAWLEVLSLYDYKEKRLLKERVVPFGGGRIVYDPSGRIYTGSEMFPMSFAITLPEDGQGSLSFSLFMDFRRFNQWRTGPPGLFLRDNRVLKNLEDSYLTELAAFSKKWNMGFWGQYVGGQVVIGVEPDHYRTTVYPLWNGGIHSLIVDEDYDRIIASGIWGVDVLDLRTGRVIYKVRTEIAPRLPAISRKYGVVLVTCTYGEHLWIFSRKDFRVLARIPLGKKARYPLLSQDEEILFIGNDAGHYAIPMEALACTYLKRCRGEEKEGNHETAP